jgi:hypothetical protein
MYLATGFLLLVFMISGCAFSQPPSKDQKPATQNTQKTQADNDPSSGSIVVDKNQTTDKNQDSTNKSDWGWISILGLIVSAMLLRVHQVRNNLERPWMMFRPKDPNNGIIPDGQTVATKIWPLPVMYQGLFIVPWNLINVGRSPAFLTKIVARIELVNRGSTPPNLPSESDFPGYIVSAKAEPDDRFGTNLFRPLTVEESIDIQNGEKEIWVYGIVEYKGFRIWPWPHSTRFCCRWYVGPVEGPAYDPVGPEGWTEYT